MTRVRSVLIVLGGFVAGLSAFVVPLWPLAFIAPVPLLLTILAPKIDVRRAACAGFLFGGVMSATAVFWLWHALPIDWLIGSSIGGWWMTFFSWSLTALALAFGTAVFSALAHVVATRTFGDVGIIPLLWIVGEEVRMWMYALLAWAPHSLFEPHFSFGSIGYALAQSPLFLQMADPGGVRSLSFFTVCIATSIIFVFTASRRQALFFAGAMTGVSLLVVGGALSRAEHVQEQFTRTVPIAIITTYLSQERPLQSIAGHYKEFLHDAAAHQGAPRIILFPEGYGLSGIFGTEEKQREALAHIFATSTLVVHTTAVTREDGTRILEIQYVDSSVGILARSEKRFLAPQGESIPSIAYVLTLPFQSDEKLRAHIAQNEEYRTGYRQTAAPFGRLLFGALFCSEITSPTLYAELVRREHPDILLNLASQAWFNGSILLFDTTQSMARVHAVQNRLPFVTAMNGAPSYALDALGRTILESPWGEEGVMVVNVPTYTK